MASKNCWDSSLFSIIFSIPDPIEQIINVVGTKPKKSSINVIFNSHIKYNW